MKFASFALLSLAAATFCRGQDAINFRVHDVRLGYFYEVRQDANYNRDLFVYKNRTDSIDKPAFTTDLNIFSAFHSPDGRFLVVNYGSSSYGNVSTVLDGKAPFRTVYISEDDYRTIIDAGLKAVYPNFSNGHLYHIYAPIRDIRDGKALFYASGDFVFNEPEGGFRQERFKGVFFSVDLTTKKITHIDQKDGPMAWYRGLPDPDAIYGSGVFVAPNVVLTNAHVVGTSERVLVALGNKETWAKPTSVSKRFDLALLSIPNNSLSGHPIKLSSAKPTLGARIRTCGYPLPMVQGYTLKVTDGTISGVFGLADDPLQFQMTAPIQPGNSGGAIVDESGRLVGIAVSSIDKVKVSSVAGFLPENVNFGIHADVIKRFLKDNNIDAISDEQPFDPELSCVQIISPQ